MFWPLPFYHQSRTLPCESSHGHETGRVWQHARFGRKASRQESDQLSPEGVLRFIPASSLGDVAHGNDAPFHDGQSSQTPGIVALGSKHGRATANAVRIV